MSLSIEEILSSLPSQEGLQIEYKGKKYFRPYQTFTYKGQTFEGLRKMTDRVEIFERILNENSVERDSYLDIGCNLGYFVRHFSKSFSNVIGVDYNYQYTWFAKTVYEELKERNIFVNADLNKQRLSNTVSPANPKDGFNFITALSMIEYINDKDAFLSDIFDLLKVGGVCIFEGHSLDINNGNDKIYEEHIRKQKWQVTRMPFLTDIGLNAPKEAIGRPMWVCVKK